MKLSHYDYIIDTNHPSSLVEKKLVEGMLDSIRVTIPDDADEQPRAFANKILKLVGADKFGVAIKNKFIDVYSMVGASLQDALRKLIYNNYQAEIIKRTLPENKVNDMSQEKLDEAYTDSMPLWVKQWLKGDGKFIRTNYQWDKITYKDLPIPETAQQAAFKGDQNTMRMFRIDKQIVPNYLDRGSKGTLGEGNVFIPGVNDIYIRKSNGSNRPISKVPYSYWKQYIMDYGELDGFDYKSDEIKQARDANWYDASDRFIRHPGKSEITKYSTYSWDRNAPNDVFAGNNTRRKNTATYGQAPGIRRSTDYDGNYVYNPEWHINSGSYNNDRDKSGYRIDFDKYKKMLRALQADDARLASRIDNIYSELKAVASRIANYMTNMDFTIRMDGSYSYGSSSYANYKELQNKLAEAYSYFTNGFEYMENAKRYKEYVDRYHNEGDTNMEQQYSRYVDGETKKMLRCFNFCEINLKECNTQLDEFEFEVNDAPQE